MRAAGKRGDRVAVAIVGAGLMGRWHAYSAARAGGRVAAIVDPDSSRAARLARRFSHASVFTSLEPCLRECDIAAVHVCAPTSAHGESIGTSLAAGKHVLAEKPLALSAAETSKRLDQAANENLLLTAVHQFPFQRGAQRTAARRDELGKFIRLDFLLCSAGGEYLRGEARREALLGMVPHPVSLFRFFLGWSPAASAWRVEAWDADELELASELGGVRLGIQISLRGRPTRCQLTILGTRGTARLDLFHGFSTLERGRRSSRLDKVAAPFRSSIGLLASAAVNLSVRAFAREPAYPGLAPLIGRFYRAIREGSGPPVAPAEVLDAALLTDRLRAMAAD